MNGVLILVLGYNVLLAKGFLPSQESTDGRKDYTHASITQAAIYRATAYVIANVIDPTKYNASDPDGTIQKYFDHDALIKFAEIIMQIVEKNNLAQMRYRDVAARTMNCERIEEGHRILQSLRDNIFNQSQSASPDWDAVRDLIGQYLFTLQVFYSNTNWVEMFGNRVCHELGVPGESLPLNVSGPNMVACVNCNYSKEAVQHFSCINNTLSNSPRLTSGYTDFQGIIKPIGTGLLYNLGFEKFTEMLGINQCKSTCYCLAPGLSVVYAIDNKKSMRDEIREAAQNSINIVNQATILGMNGPSNYVLSTFNDLSTTIRNTTDGHVFTQWLHSLQVGGGNGCPVLAFTGLINAMKIASPGSCVFFFSDADPKDTERLNEVIQLVNSKNIKLIYLLRGECSSRRRRSYFTVRDARDVFKRVARVRQQTGGFDIFDNMAYSTPGQATRTSSSPVESSLGSFVKNTKESPKE